jgi:hypothetical protein
MGAIVALYMISADIAKGIFYKREKF